MDLVTAWFGHVRLWELYLIAFLTGVLGVGFGLAYHAFFPIFVAKPDLPEANAKIGTTEAVARVVGAPALRRYAELLSPVVVDTLRAPALPPAAWCLHSPA